MESLGAFAVYAKEGDNPHSILFARNAEGTDWYDLKDLQGAFVVVDGEGGIVSFVETDITRIFPADQTVYQLSEIETVPEVGMQLNGGVFTAPVGETWRETASLPRKNFCLALLNAGILTKEAALDAAKGNWPQIFSSALAGVPEELAIQAEFDWATAQNVLRNHPILSPPLAAVAWPELNTEARDIKLDELFGWKETV